MNCTEEDQEDAWTHQTKHRHQPVSTRSSGSTIQYNECNATKYSKINEIKYNTKQYNEKTNTIVVVLLVEFLVRFARVSIGGIATIYYCSTVNRRVI